MENDALRMGIDMGYAKQILTFSIKSVSAFYKRIIITKCAIIEQDQ